MRALFLSICFLLLSIAGLHAFAPPTVDGFSALEGCAGDTVLVFGTDLNTADSVYMAGLKASIAQANADTIWAVVPSAALGRIGRIKVFAPAGDAASLQDFTIKASPAISLSLLDADICDNEEAQLAVAGPSGVAYTLWIDGEPEAESFSETLIQRAFGEGFYELNVSASYLGCTGFSDVHILNVNGTEPASIDWPTENSFTDARDTVQLIGSPEGGEFSGPGVANNVFSPQFVGFENSPYTITYTYTSLFGCVSEASLVIAVVDDANSITGLSTQYCENADTLEIFSSQAPNPAEKLVGLSNITTGTGVSPAIRGAASYRLAFAAMGVGKFEIQALYYDTIQGTFSSKVQVIVVNPAPEVSFTGLEKGSYCEGDEYIDMHGNQDGGVFSGDGVFDYGDGSATFYTYLADIGQYEVVYEFTNAFGCTNADTQTFVLHPLPSVEATGLSDFYCYNADSVLLVANVAGGAFSGDGVIDNGNGQGYFVPSKSLADVGIDSATGFDVQFSTVVYTYTDGNGCSNTWEMETAVGELPALSFEVDATDRVCAQSYNRYLYGEATSAAGEGGFGQLYGIGVVSSQYEGDGLTEGSFDPTHALEISGISLKTPKSFFTLTFEHTDARGCVNSVSDTMLVRGTPDVTFDGLDSAYCAGDEALNVTTKPAPIYNQDFEYYDIFYGIYDLNADYLGAGIEGLDDGTIEFSPRDAVVGNDYSPYIDNEVVLGVFYTDSFGCSLEYRDTILIKAIPELAIEGITDGAEFCHHDMAYTLVGNNSLGTFGGYGVVNGEPGKASFVPTAAIDERGGSDGAQTQIDISYSATIENGCSNSIAVAFIINEPPNIAVKAIDGWYCTNDDEEDLEVNLFGASGEGFFIGPGVENTGYGTGEFYPTLAYEALGGSADSAAVEIVYLFADDNTGCTNADTLRTTLRRPAPAAFNGLPAAEFCESAPIISLSGNPLPDNETTYGAFFGYGISDPDLADGKALFDPKRALAEYLNQFPNERQATFQIQYIYADAFECEQDTVVQLTVFPLPKASLQGYNSNRTYCFSDAPFLLTGNAPQEGETGVFIGAGIVDNGNGTAIYHPKKAFENRGLDSLSETLLDRVIYRFTNANGCIDSADVILTVRPVPNIVNFSPQTICYGDSIQLRPSPNIAENGGLFASFAGEGVADNGLGRATFFSDALAASDLVQVANLRYTYTNNNGCTNSKEIAITVNPLPAASFNGLDPDYCYNAADVLLTGTSGINSQGIFAGNGIRVLGSGTAIFDPSQAANQAGADENAPSTEHVILYTYRDANGCIDRVFDTVYVHPQPKVNFGILNNCGAEAISFRDSTAAVDVASWLWNFGESGNTSLAQHPSYQYGKADNYSVSLTVTSTKGCSSIASKPVRVGGKPTANFNFSNICLGDTVAFSAAPSRVANSSVDQITAWEWQFSDPNGTSSVNNALAKHLFSGVGTYPVTLKITTNNDCSDAVTKHVSIVPAVKSVDFAQAPYFESFEDNQGGWVAGGQNSSWEWGIPNAAGSIDTAAHGQKVWMTSLSSAYDTLENSYIDGPCFDFSSLTRPMISLKVWAETDSTKDGAALQYSEDGGISWMSVGDLTDAYNWYDAGVRAEMGGNVVGQPGWTGQYGQWRTARRELDFLKGKKSVRLRMVFGSDAAPDDRAGFAFDEVWIGSRSKTVLVEHFTNSSKASDATANTQLNALISSIGQPDVVGIQYHTASASGAQPDVLNERNTADPSARALFYGVANTPSSVLDGQLTATLSQKSIMKQLLGTDRLLGMASMSLALSYSDLPEGTLNVRMHLTANEALDGELLAQLAIVEREITQVTGANGENRFEWTLRQLLPNAAGTSFQRTWQAGDTASVAFQWPVADIYDPNQVAIVAFVQRSGTKEVLQALYEVPSKLPPIVSGVEDRYLLHDAVLYPNPARDKAFVRFGSDATAAMAWTVHNALGQVVATGQIDRGSNGFSIETAHLPSGLYVVEVQAEGRIVWAKKMIMAP